MSLADCSGPIKTEYILWSYLNQTISSRYAVRWTETCPRSAADVCSDCLEALLAHSTTSGVIKKRWGTTITPIFTHIIGRSDSCCQSAASFSCRHLSCCFVFFLTVNIQLILVVIGSHAHLFQVHIYLHVSLTSISTSSHCAQCVPRVSHLSLELPLPVSEVDWWNFKTYKVYFMSNLWCPTDDAF